jgi:hypothetical protein
MLTRINRSLRLKIKRLLGLERIGLHLEILTTGRGRVI